MHSSNSHCSCNTALKNTSSGTTAGSGPKTRRIPFRVGSAFASARAPAGSIVDANTPATAALAVWRTSRLVPSNKSDDDGVDAPILSVDVDDGGGVMNASPAATTQSASRARKVWEIIGKRLWRGNGVL